MGTIPNTYTVQPDVSADISRRVRSTRFGEGYEQRALDGINNIHKTWTVSFTPGTTANMDALASIIEGDLGWNITLWQAPDESVNTKWIIRGYSKKYLAGRIVEISATFERAYL